MRFKREVADRRSPGTPTSRLPRPCAGGAGLPCQLCRKLVQRTTFYHWKKRYAGMGVQELRRSSSSEEIGG